MGNGEPLKFFEYRKVIRAVLDREPMATEHLKYGSPELRCAPCVKYTLDFPLDTIKRI